MPVTGHAGVIARWIGADGSETDLEDRYLELFCLAKRFLAFQKQWFRVPKTLCLGWVPCL